MTSTASLRAYYELAKPGIVYGNVLVAAAGFLYAAAGHPNWFLLTVSRHFLFPIRI